jgi:hypothetical protein
MKTKHLLLLTLVIGLVGVAGAQQVVEQPPDGGGGGSLCRSLIGAADRVCFNADGCVGIGSIPLLDSCNLDQSCYNWQSYNYDCGCDGAAVQGYIGVGYCMMAELKGPKARSEILELARREDILVPSCQGIYLPAQFILRED